MTERSGCSTIAYVYLFRWTELYALIEVIIITLVLLPAQRLERGAKRKTNETISFRQQPIEVIILTQVLLTEQKCKVNVNICLLLKKLEQIRISAPGSKSKTVEIMWIMTKAH